MVLGESDGDAVLVVGLGNPGPTYAGNRHNVGFMVVDELAHRVGARFKSHRAGSDIVEARFAGHRVILVKPRSYMNVSGGPAVGTAKFFKVPAEHTVVLHDDLDLPFGAIRLKLGGGEGGHNGLRSLSKSFATRDYVRVRFGVGRPPGRMDPADFVLRDFTGTERRELPVLLAQCADATEMLISRGLEHTQNHYHAP